MKFPGGASDETRSSTEMRYESRRDARNVGEGLPRAVEVVAALVALIVSSPVLLVALAMIRLTSGAPVVFGQQRVGQSGRPFTLLKLRTMRMHRGGPQVTGSQDPRITVVGRALRFLKVDELPQLWNVIRGDMSLVGPRPEVPRYVNAEDKRWEAVLAAKPGLTDPVTLELRNEEKLLASIEGDVERYYIRMLLPYKVIRYQEYLRRRTPLSDVRVLLLTAASIILPRLVPMPTLSEIESTVTRTPDGDCLDPEEH